MLGNEKMKAKLLLEYKICELYMKSGASTSSLSEVVGIPLATVKRGLKTFLTNREAFLKLLPELGDEEDLLEFQNAIVKRINENKKFSKTGNLGMQEVEYPEEIMEIRNLYEEKDTSLTPGKISEIENLRLNGASFRTIAKAVGVSLSTAHKFAGEKQEGKGR